MIFFAGLSLKIRRSKKAKILILSKILLILVIIFILRLFFIITDLHKNTKAFENNNSLNIYAINLLTKPFSIMADKYAIKNKKKIAIFYNYEKQEIIDNEKNNCYIMVVKRPNIFLQNKIENEDFIAMNMQISAIINNNDNNTKLYSIAALIDFIEKNKMVLILNKNNSDIKEAIVGWYEKYITANVCLSIAQKIVPLGKYSINDISHRQVIISNTKVNDVQSKYILDSNALNLISNVLVAKENMIDFLRKEVDIIFVNSSELINIKSEIQNRCIAEYLNNDFAKMLQNIDLKNISEIPLQNNEIAIGLTNDIIPFGKIIYTSSNKEDLITWLIANGQNKAECRSFFQFLRKNENILNQYSIKL